MTHSTEQPTCALTEAIKPLLQPGREIAEAEVAALRAQAEAHTVLRDALGRVQALSRGYKAMSKSMVRLILESVHEEASPALAQAGGEG